MTDPANMVTAIGTLLTGMGTLATAVWTRRVHQQVKTANGSTLGETVEQVREEVSTPDDAPSLGEIVATTAGALGELADRTPGEGTPAIAPPPPPR